VEPFFTTETSKSLSMIEFLSDNIKEGIPHKIDWLIHQKSSLEIPASTRETP